MQIEVSIKRLRGKGSRIWAVSYHTHDTCLCAQAEDTCFDALDFVIAAPGIQCGYFFGPGSPLNWDKDLKVEDVLHFKQSVAL